MSSRRILCYRSTKWSPDKLLYLCHNGVFTSGIKRAIIAPAVMSRKKTIDSMLRITIKYNFRTLTFYRLRSGAAIVGSISTAFTFYLAIIIRASYYYYSYVPVKVP